MKQREHQSNEYFYCLWKEFFIEHQDSQETKNAFNPDIFTGTLLMIQMNIICGLIKFITYKS